jgi:hypothetical protein
MKLGAEAHSRNATRYRFANPSHSWTEEASRIALSDAPRSSFATQEFLANPATGIGYGVWRQGLNGNKSRLYDRDGMSVRDLLPGTARTANDRASFYFAAVNRDGFR